MTAVITSVSPQAPTDVVAEVPVTEPAAVRDLAEQARAAQRDWATAPPAVRAGALAAWADRLESRAAEATDLAIREVGKPRGEAAGEVARAVAILRYYAQQSFAPRGDVLPPALGGLLWSERRPHGVAGLVTPWNFPFAIPLWKAAPALAVGNAVLLKPSPDAVASALWLAGLAEGVLPDGLLAVVPGGPATGEAVVEASDVVSFTGSAAVGAAVTASAAARGVPVQAEMGGHNAAVVLPDADLTVAAGHIVGAAMGYAGQKCTATRRVVVVGDRARRDEVVEVLRAALAGLGVGDPAEAAVAAGPVISAAARDRVLSAVGDATAAGASTLGAALPGAAGDGYWVAPTLLLDVPDGHWVLTEEVFGPLATVQQAADLDEAAALANHPRYGLTTSVHGRDGDAVLALLGRLESGLVRVNAPTAGVDFYAPFGGSKASSYGQREQGLAALDFYTTTRTVTWAPEGGS